MNYARTLLSTLCTVLAIALLAGAQAIPTIANSTPGSNVSFAAGRFVANNYNYAGASVYTGNAATGSSSMTIRGGYVVLPDGRAVEPFAVGVPIVISDGTPELVVPTSVSGCYKAQGMNQDGVFVTCTVTASFTYTHGVGAQVLSGTNGLAEAQLDAFNWGGGVVALAPGWPLRLNTSCTNCYASKAAAFAALLPYANVSFEDDTVGPPQYWNATPSSATVLAVPATLTSGTVGSNLGAASGIAGSASWGSTVYGCIAYVDVLGNEGPCSATYNFTSTASQAIGWTTPAASNGAVGWVAYLSLSGGTYALAYRVPVASMHCTLTQIETVTAACALANSTYSQSGSTAYFTSYPVNTARIWVGTGGTSSTSDYVGNTNSRISYAYAPSNHIALPGVVSASLPFTGATAPATTVPAVIGTVELPAGFMNYVGRTIRICGLVKEASAGSTATISTIQFLWNADGSNTAGAGVILGGPTVTATLVTSNADQWSFCQNLKTTVAGASATAGSILAGTGWLTASYGAATTVAAATGPTIGAAAVGSLNLASEARIDVVYLHTTGTDGATPILQDLTVEVVN